MNQKFIRVFGYVLAANGQAVLLIFASKEIIAYLSSNFPQSFSWDSVVWPTIILVIAHTYYVIIRNLIRSEQRDSKEKEND